MVVRKTQIQKDTFYFCTFTCTNWLSLFRKVKGDDIVYKWFDWMKENKNPIVGYVIMPNHLHVIFYLHPDSKIVNKIISNAKRFMAYEIVKRLEALQEEWTLYILASAVDRRERKNGKIHRVFTSSFDAQAIEDVDTMRKKLHYMHKNPISGKWKLVDDMVDYKHSSARWYEIGEHAAYEVIDYGEVEFVE